MRTSPLDTHQTGHSRARANPSFGGSTLLALLILLTLAPGAAACLAIEAHSAARTVLREPVYRTIGIIRSARVTTTSTRTTNHHHTNPPSSETHTTNHHTSSRHIAPISRVWGIRAGIAAFPPPGA